MSRKFSDLPFMPGHEKVIVLQPSAARLLKKGTFYQHPDNRDALYASVLSDLERPVNFLVHAGSFTCYRYQDNPGEASIVGPSCGGAVHIRPVWKSVAPDAKFQRDYKTIITCGNRDCKMTLGSRLDITEWPNVLFHLALKQMVPDLPTLNYTNCLAKEEGHTEQQRKDLEAVRAFGVVSIASEIVCGIIDNGFFDKFDSVYSIGFMLVPGMDTCNGCGGVVRWLQLLVQEKFKRLKDEHNQKLSWLIGPKPASR
jgi:hypothetical protein